jgi:acyl carrier protein
MDQRQRIRKLLADLLLERDDARPFTDSESLLLSGRLDSLNIVAIVVFLESEFGLSIDPSDFDPMKLGSVDDILALLQTA